MAGSTEVPGSGRAVGSAPAGGPGTLVVANHVSWLDVPALLAVEPVALLAKRQVGGWPVVGTLARRLGTRFVHRERLRELPYLVEDLARLLASGRSVLVFPQATTWCSVAGGGFHQACFQAAVETGAPVRPVTLDYFQGTARTRWAGFLGEEHFGSSLRRVTGAAGLTVRITAHPPLTGTDRRVLAERARIAVLGGQLPVHPGAGRRGVEREGAGLRGAGRWTG
ncbi:1-acyl-sn-glycerol-3-phosphate acyltransferase [Streptomyces sp. LD120]|uniref:1-acyl-sn-glycerol-3-phosphate acyltransferase n=2 Tax=Streptomyces physcomitrii TaxID=2724184 RepID=A0ABX1GZA6_9ACTN|nr:1-acyl-sn-glycerol-3-phosphate acyltransferase [Streptomyces physcomitrii]